MPKVKTKYKDLLFQDKMRALRLALDYPDVSILDINNIPQMYDKGAIYMGEGYPRAKSGKYGKGKGGGAGSTTTWRGLRIPLVDLYKTDTIFDGRNFNQAFKEARKAGLDTFEFNNKTYTTEVGNNPNSQKVGNERLEYTILPIPRWKTELTPKEAEELLKKGWVVTDEYYKELADGGNLDSKSYYRELLSIPYAPNINKYGWGSNLILGIKDAGIFKSEDGGNALSAANIGKSVGSAIKGGIGAIGNTVGKIGGSLISNGYTSTAGKVASVASGLASHIPGPIGGIASAAIGVLGGVANRAFGTKTDLEKLNNANQNIAELSNFQSNAGSFDDLAYTPASVNIAGTFKDGWFSHSAAKKQRALENQLAEAKGWALNSVRNNTNNLINDLNDLLAQQFFALGGYMPSFGGGAIDYQLATDRINIDRIKADKNDKITSLPNSSNNPLNNNSLLSNFAFGGPILSTYTEGSIYNLSEKEIERLRALGYEIEEVK